MVVHGAALGLWQDSARLGPVEHLLQVNGGVERLGWIFSVLLLR